MRVDVCGGFKNIFVFCYKQRELRRKSSIDMHHRRDDERIRESIHIARMMLSLKL